MRVILTGEFIRVEAGDANMKSVKYYQRKNIITGYVNQKSIYPMSFNKLCNALVFAHWVKQFLRKELKSFWVMIMNNVSINLRKHEILD